MTIDWQEVIKELKLDFNNCNRIAAKANIPAYTVRRLDAGETEQPRFDDGLLIIKIFKGINPHRYEELIEALGL